MEGGEDEFRREAVSGFELFKGERVVASATWRSRRMGRHSESSATGLKGCCEERAGEAESAPGSPA